MKELRRKLERFKRQRDELEKRHKGNEEKYTYHGGFDLGYLKGKISAIENILDMWKESNER